MKKRSIHASIRCLGVEGNFLEFGKFDLTSDNFLKKFSFYSDVLENLLKATHNKHSLSYLVLCNSCNQNLLLLDNRKIY